jgi:hypothetical protein
LFVTDEEGILLDVLPVTRLSDIEVVVLIGRDPRPLKVTLTDFFYNEDTGVMFLSGSTDVAEFSIEHSTHQKVYEDHMLQQISTSQKKFIEKKNGPAGYLSDLLDKHTYQKIQELLKESGF